MPRISSQCFPLYFWQSSHGKFSQAPISAELKRRWNAQMFLRHLMTSMSQVLCRTRWHLFLMIKTKSGQGQKKPCHIPTAAMYFCLSVFFMGFWPCSRRTLQTPGWFLCCAEFLVMNFLIDLGLIAAISCFDIAAFLVNSKLGCKKIQTCFFDIWVWHVDHWCFSMLVFLSDDQNSGSNWSFAFWEQRLDFSVVERRRRDLKGRSLWLIQFQNSIMFWPHGLSFQGRMKPSFFQGW